MSLQYRPDIDGLRAVAILSVVVFHADLGLVGGFTGVDVFFVISGYLITQVLEKDFSDHGRISFLNFYARRVARIAPTLVLVVLAVAAFGATVLTVSTFEVQALMKSGISSILFSSNLYFFAISGDYFGAPASDTPLLHTWSLGIEEQYYLVWPLLLATVGRFSGKAKTRRAFLLAVLALSLASIAYGAAIRAASPSLAFYSPLSRIWELGIGSVLALLPRLPLNRRLAMAAAGSGAMFVAAGTILSRPGADFPVPFALLPTLGTALIILGNTYSQGSPLYRMLAARGPVAVGKVSYAWYLWHWPFLSFGHILNSGPLSPQTSLVILGASFVAAYVTVAVYETPLRNLARRHSSRRVVLAGALAGATTLAVLIGIYAAAKLGVLRDDPRIPAAFGDRPSRNGLCMLQPHAPIDFPAGCLGGDRLPEIVLWGDSHAGQWGPVVELWARANGWQFEQLTRVACPPLLGLTPAAVGGGPYSACKLSNRLALQHIIDGTSPKIVVLASNWRPRIEPEADAPTSFFDYRAGNSAQSVAAMRQGLTATLDALEHAGIPVVVVLQTPVPGRLVAVCIVRAGQENCGLSAASLERQTSAVNRIIVDVVHNRPGIRLLDSAKILCNSTGCPAEIEGRVAYYDEDHVATSVAVLPRSVAAWSVALAAAARDAGKNRLPLTPPATPPSPPRRSGRR